MSFYGTILNNYPESYEPNLGKVQQIEEAFKDINTNIATNATNITNNSLNINNIKSDINTIKSDINTKVSINDMKNGLKTFRINKYTQGEETIRFDLEGVSKNDIVIIQSVGLEIRGSYDNYLPVISTQIIYKDGDVTTNNYSEVSLQVELPQHNEFSNSKVCLDGIIIDKDIFNR